ncbi:Pentafunctional AROM polypeptide [Bienertia sinuspersici]
MANDKEQGASRVSREETSTHKKKGARDPSMPRTSRQEWEAHLAKVELTVGDLRDDSAKLMEVTETVEELEGRLDHVRSQPRSYITRCSDDTQEGEGESHHSRAKNVDHGKDKARSKWESKGDSRNGDKSSKPFTCFLCDKGGHSARLCPQRSKLNAMIALMEEKESENEGRMGAMRLEEEAKLANLRLLNASKVVEKEPTGHASTTTQGADIK